MCMCSEILFEEHFMLREEKKRIWRCGGGEQKKGSENCNKKILKKLHMRWQRI